MAGERKKLDSLITSPTTAPPAQPLTSRDRTDRPARGDTEEERARAEHAARVRRRGSAPQQAPPSDMTMRSWYMPKASADRLAALVDDMHFATRLPKHLIMGALVNVIDRHRAEVEAEARGAAGQHE
jgi:hypothetical protein